MIDVSHLTKVYGPRRAVDDVAFRVDPGEIVGFLGPNGAGKSTTLRMLTGYVAPTAGAVRVGGVDVLDDPLAARRNVGYMPEGAPLYAEMRVREYLRYRAALKGVARRNIPAAVDRALEQAGVSDARERILGQLSKGYRQRVGLADALVADPPLLILDEPTAGLDPNQIRHVRALVKSFGGKKTVLVSTHILPEVEATCGRVLIIHHGRLVREGAPDTLRAEDGTQAVVARLRITEGESHVTEVPASVREWLSAIPGVRGVLGAEVETAGVIAVKLRTDARPEVAEGVFRAVAAHSALLRELRVEATSLEDVFAALTTSEPVDATGGAS